MMRNINKTFILIEAVLAAAVAVLATMMIRENTRGDLGKSLSLCRTRTTISGPRLNTD